MIGGRQPDRPPAYAGRSGRNELPCQCYLHRVAILIQDVEPGFRHVSRRALCHHDLPGHQLQAGHLRGGRVAQVDHLDRLLLTDTP